MPLLSNLSSVNFEIEFKLRGVNSVAEFKEFERRFKFKPRFKLLLVPLKIVSNVSRFRPALNLNLFLADLNRGSNSLNSISGQTGTFLV